MVSAICELTLQTSAFEQSVREPFLFGYYLQSSRKSNESQPEMKSLKFKTQAKSDHARKSDLTYHQSRTCLILSNCLLFVSTEVNEEPKYNFQSLTDF